ncbi:MAG: hypothetical protein RLZZ338_3311 [Cyanobacteriota bacterium]|jgi:PAS domain S-box-containing protein
MSLSKPSTQISGYIITEELYAGIRTLVYRGKRLSDSTPVVIKLLRNEYPSFTELVQFRNQYTIAQNLDLPNIIKTYSLELYHNSYALVMEDFGGISIGKYLQTLKETSQPFTLADFFFLALQLTDILNGLYHHRIIHKDIKPDNILINPQTKQVKLIDFSIASLLPKETQEIKNANVLEGSLAYLSPEQTGRMNKGIDYRSDFYSLGVTFFEILTGQLPFISNDPMELIHCHLAQKTPSIHSLNSDIPLVLSELVGKLMAKNAEDRYQTVLGLKYDLEECQHQWQEKGMIEPFTLGRRDLCDRFIIPEKLYGREKEVNTLLEAFDRVANPTQTALNQGIRGGGEMMLVAGFSGIGKTAIVNEIHKPIVRQRGYFIKGKFDQFRRNIPFSAFVQTFRDLMGQLLSENDASLAVWKRKIIAALGENGQVIIEVIPELEQIIGKQPPAPELSGKEAQNRFNLLFPKFVNVFTTKEHPLVIFLDDLQWADSPSLKLMQLLMNESDSGYLLLIGAYRDNEVFAAHPLMLTLDEIAKAKTTINRITLGPLSEGSLNQLVADTLGCALEIAEPLTQLVYQKTQGNPFFSTQFLKSLYEDGLIKFDGDRGIWQCDITQVKSLALTDDVVEFMALQLQKLPEATQNVLKLAACIGNQFDLATLAIVSQQSETKTAADLWKALPEGLILPLSEVYKFYVAQEQNAVSSHPVQTVVYKFLHDRVQQAAYSLIPENEKQATHLKIGRILVNTVSVEEREEKIFEIINQLNLGVELVTDVAEKNSFAELYLYGGQKALLSSAFRSAYEYFTQGIKLLSLNSWKEQYQLTLDLYIGAADAACLNTDFSLIKGIVDRALPHINKITDRVKIYEPLLRYYHTQSYFKETVNLAIEMLAQLGEYFPENPDTESFTRAFAKTNQLIEQVGFENLTKLPPMQNPEKIAAMRILRHICFPAYFGVPEMLGLIVCRLVDLTIKYGDSALTPFTFAIFSVLLNGGLNDIPNGSKFGELAITKHHQNPDFNDKALIHNLYFGLSRHFYKPVRESLEPLIEGYQSFSENGDAENCAYCIINAYFCSILAGYNLNYIQQKFEKYIDHIIKFGQEQVINQLHIWTQVLCNLVGNSHYTAQLKGDFFDAQRMLPQLYETRNFNTINYTHTAQIFLYYLFGEYELAYSHATQTEPHLGASTGKFLVISYNLYYSLALAVIYPDASPVQQKKYWEKLLANQKQMKLWADYNSANCLHKYLLVEAEMARISGKKLDAIELYDRAIAIAQENKYIQEEALGNELAAKLYLNWGKEKIAQTYMIEAYYGYARWGAKAKTDDLEKRYSQLLYPILQVQQNPILLRETSRLTLNQSSIINQTLQTTRSSTNTISEVLDLATILKVSQALSSEIKIEKFLETFMEVVLENSGARKVALLVVKDGNLVIESLATTHEGITLLSVPLESSKDIPITLVNYVKHSLNTVLLDDATAQKDWLFDSYVIGQKPKSLLCLPILHQGKFIGLLYLENNLTIGAFTRDRLELIQLICSQATISLENARLYAAEKEKNHKLQRSLDKLHQSEMRFKELFEKSVDAILLLSDQGFIDCNKAAMSLFGYSYREQLCAIHPSQISPELQPDNQSSFEKVNGMISEALNNGSHQFEWVHQRANGDNFWAEVTLTLIPYDGEQILHCLVRDISDRKQAEIALKQKSQELEEALKNLQQAQLQMIQSEKMSALGNLVAGVAHEINNPIGFISGNLNEYTHGVQDLIDCLQLYQQKFPDPGTEIIEKIEEVDLDYLLDDLPKMLTSMKTGCDRIKNISTSLRVFSRGDTQIKVPANLHAGIDSTLMILQHRLKASENRPAIEVIKNYGNIPEIKCFLGQLNQVFMNILANAIDAFEEVNRSRSYQEIERAPNIITITTFFVEENSHAVIKIKDNAWGMPEEVKVCIFDHLFTTKGVGKGTGLGLAIARQIIEETHHGTLICNSTVGEGTEFVIEIPR